MLKFVAGVTLLIGVGALIFSGPFRSLSLAGDVGLTEEAVCDALERDGPAAIRRLNESGFPHATLDPVEVYRLTREGTPEAFVHLDWAQDQAQCLPLDYTGPVSASLDLSEAAYRLVVQELRRALTTGETSTSAFQLGKWWTLYWGSDIRIPSNPDYERPYERTVTRWVMGYVTGED